MNHQKADVDRLCVPKSEKGRGLVQLEQSYKTRNIGFQRYKQSTEDCMRICVKEYERSKVICSIIKKCKMLKIEFPVNEEVQVKHHTPSEAAKYFKKIVKANAIGHIQK